MRPPAACRRWGFSVAAGGSFVGLAAASPEIGIDSTSAVRGVGDIGLGARLGSDVIAIPIMVATAYPATRKRELVSGTGASTSSPSIPTRRASSSFRTLA